MWNLIKAFTDKNLERLEEALEVMRLERQMEYCIKAT